MGEIKPTLLYRVTRKVGDEWVPVAGGLRIRKLRVYPDLGTARSVKTQWVNQSGPDELFRIESTLAGWEVFE